MAEKLTEQGAAAAPRDTGGKPVVNESGLEIKSLYTADDVKNGPGACNGAA